MYCEKREVSMSLHVKVDPPENESKKRPEEKRDGSSKDNEDQLTARG